MSKEKTKTNRPQKIKKPFSRNLILGLTIVGFILVYISIFVPTDCGVYAYVGVEANDGSGWMAQQQMRFQGWDLIFGDYNKRAFTRGLPALASSWICIIISCAISLIGLLLRIGDKRKLANIFQLIGGWGAFLAAGNFGFITQYNGSSYADPMYTPDGLGRFATPAHLGRGFIMLMLFGTIGGLMIAIAARMDQKNQKRIPIWNNVYPDNQYLSNGKTLKQAGGKIVAADDTTTSTPTAAA